MNRETKQDRDPGTGGSRPPPRQFPPPPGTPQTGRSIWNTVLLLFFIAMLGYLLVNGFTGSRRITLPYSTFLDQVGEGNVAEVTINGNTITGDFKNTYTAAIDNGRDTVSYASFTCVNPGYDNETLMAALKDNQVIIRATAQRSSWLTWFLLLLLPWVLIIAVASWYMRRQLGSTFGDDGGLFGVGKSRAKRYIRSVKTAVSFDDVAGLDGAKKDLLEIVEYLKNPDKFSALGADIPKGVLLMGPPGTGKTLLARAAAGEAGVPFFSTSGSEFIEMFVGVGASRVRDMFNNAKTEAPSIIFIDEVDSIGRSRGIGYGGGVDEHEQTLNQILSEMDGFAPNESVVVMAATNRPDVLDPALTRPGRFDRQIVLELPERGVRLKILKIHTRHVPLGPDVNLDTIAARTVGFSGADLKNLVNEAALLAGRRSKRVVEAEDFDEAGDKILLGNRREEKISDAEKRLIAYHEAGHALVAKLLPETDPLQKVTIVARGRSLGVTEQIPEMDRHNLNMQYLLSRLTVALAGRASERVVFDELTNGAVEDLRQSTKLARKMVCRWGMSDRVGPSTYNEGEENAFLRSELLQPRDFSEYTARLIDEEVQRILKEMENRAIELLQKNRHLLDSIAAALLERETLLNEDIDRIMKS